MIQRRYIKTSVVIKKCKIYKWPDEKGKVFFSVMRWSFLILIIISQGIPGREGPIGQPGFPGCNGTKVAMLTFSTGHPILLKAVWILPGRGRDSGDMETHFHFHQWKSLTRDMFGQFLPGQGSLSPTATSTSRIFRNHLTSPTHDWFIDWGIDWLMSSRAMLGTKDSLEFQDLLAFE